MPQRKHTYAIRLAVEGGGQVKAELVSVGQSGEQSLKRIETAGGKASGGLKGLGRQAELLRTGIRTLGGALIGAATVGGLGALIDRSISAADAVGKTADKIGVGVEALQELRFAAKASGVAQQTLDMALQRFTRRAAEAAQGTGEAKDALAQMGIALRDQSGNLRRSEDLLGDVADAFARIEDPAERVRLAFKLFDSEGVARVNLLRKLATVAAGRAEMLELTDPAAFEDSEPLRWSVSRFTLGPLSVKDAKEMVDLLGRALVPDWNPAWSEKIAGKRSDPEIRREPLTLRIAVEVVRNAPPEARLSLVDRIDKLGESADDSFVGRLYEDRILDHIGDKNARRLAWRGLVVRRLTREIARTVIGPLCGLDRDLIDAAFERLGREVWIVTRDDAEDAVIHQPDLRARTLPLMRQRKEFFEVASAMVEYHGKSDPADPAEQAYYRLLRGDNPSFLDEIWSDRIASALRPALGDFEPGSPASNYLHARLSARLLPREHLSKLPDQLAWEHVARAGRTVRRFDDEKIDWRVVDLSERSDWRITSGSAAAARRTILIKAGRWSAVEGELPLEGMDDADLDATAFVESACAGISNRTGQTETLHHLAEEAFGTLRFGVEGWTALALLLRAAAVGELDLHSRIDIGLAEILPSLSEPQMAQCGALRTAIVFGARCRPAALRLYARAMFGRTRRRPTISAAEVRRLLDGLTTRVEDAAALRDLARDWIESGDPKRIDDPAIVDAAFTLLRYVADEQSRGRFEMGELLGAVFSARIESWIVPVGYLLARGFGEAGLPDEVIAPLSDYQMARSGYFGFPKLTRPSPPPRDLLKLARFADEAGALPQLLTSLSELGLFDRCSEEVREDFLLIRNALVSWQSGGNRPRPHVVYA